VSGEGSLEGTRIAVAGAGGLLGPHVVRALASRGAAVLAADRREDALDAVRELTADARVADLSSDEGAASWAAACGEVNGLVHLVGGWRGGTSVEETDLADLEWLETGLFRTVVHATRAFAPALKAAGARGRFAIVSSSVVGRPTAGNAAYAAKKAAAEAWTLALAAELKETRGTANVVVVNALTDDPGHKSFVHVGEVAEALAYLCSDAARRMTGQRLHLHA
jgi:NAD(P)-dependent dehydrogenase (short-subunit alcohol dehydrogenase family)